MARARLQSDPYLSDPDGWGVSLAEMAPLIIPCLEAIGARSVAEIGAYAGDLTRILADWAEESGSRVLAIDPCPQDRLAALCQEAPGLELVRRTSLEALPDLDLPDALIIDGDHNYFTVSRELALIAGRASGGELPLLLFHDVCWPHGRRDDYFSPQAIPEDFRHPLVGEEAGIFPGDPGVRSDGLPYPRSAALEGGPRNGVLTAIEEFVASREQAQLVVIPVFFGFGAVWDQRAGWAAEVAGVLGPWDRHPILARLEANRIRQIAERHAAAVARWQLEARISRQEAVLRRLLGSSAFALAERFSKLRVRAGIATHEAAVSRDLVNRALEP